VAEPYPDDGELDAALAEAEALIFKAQRRRRDPDPYARVALHWLVVPQAQRIHLLLHLIHSLSLEQKQALREACEEDMPDWGAAWE